MVSVLPLELVLKLRDEASEKLQQAAGHTENLGKKLLALGAGGAVAGVTAVATGIAKLAMDAAQIPEVSRKFDALTASIGTTADAMLSEMSAAVRGTVSNFELMQQGNRLMSMGLADSSAQAARLAEIAYQLGDPTQSVTTNMENLALMLANQSIPRLDSFGISGAAVRSRIEELMSAEQGMSRETAFMTAFMEQAQVAMERVGPRSLTLADQMTQVKVQIENAKDAIGVAFIPILSALVGAIVPVVAQIAQSLVPAAQSLAAWITGNLVPAINALSPVVETVFGLVVNVIQGAIDFLQPFIQGFLETISGNWETYYGTIQTTVETVLSVIQSTIETVLGLVESFWQTHGETIQGIAGSAWNLVKSAIETVLGLVQAVVSTAAGLIESIWSAHGETIKTAAGTVWGLIKTAIEGALILIQGVINTATALIHGDWETAWNTVKDTLNNIWTAMKNGVGEHIQNIKQAIVDKIEEIKRWVGEQIAKFTELGQNIIDGIKTGVGNAVGGLVESVKGAIGNAVDAAKRLLGISSPSKAFTEFGEAMMEGLQFGVESKTQQVIDTLVKIFANIKSDAAVQAAEVAAILVGLGRAVVSIVDALHQLATYESQVTYVGVVAMIPGLAALEADLPLIVEAFKRLSDQIGKLVSVEMAEFVKNLESMIKPLKSITEAMDKFKEYAGAGKWVGFVYFIPALESLERDIPLVVASLRRIYGEIQNMLTLELLTAMEDLHLVISRLPELTQDIADTVTAAMNFLTLDAPENKGALIEFRAAVQEAVAFVMNELRRLFEYLVAFKGEIGRFSLEAEGQNVGRSFVDGIRSMYDAARQAGIGLAEAARSGAAGALEIASPSGVFMRLGEQSGHGFQIGLARTMAPVYQTFNLNYTALRQSAGYSDAAQQMRILELMARLHNG